MKLIQLVLAAAGVLFGALHGSSTAGDFSPPRIGCTDKQVLRDLVMCQGVSDGSIAYSECTFLPTSTHPDLSVVDGGVAIECGLSEMCLVPFTRDVSGDRLYWTEHGLYEALPVDAYDEGLKPIFATGIPGTVDPTPVPQVPSVRKPEQFLLPEVAGLPSLG